MKKIILIILPVFLFCACEISSMNEEQQEEIQEFQEKMGKKMEDLESKMNPEKSKTKEDIDSSEMDTTSVN
jgi:hypothetical protein